MNENSRWKPLNHKYIDLIHLFLRKDCIVI